MTTPNDVIDFWFETADAPDFKESRKRWFEKNAALDEEVRQRFLSIYQRMVHEEPESWMQTADGALALIILFDQFPRNMFRDEPRAFATDARALDTARHAVKMGFDRALATPHHRMFCYLPFEHSEDLSDQKRCLELMKDIPGSMEENGYHHWALMHHDIIARFGRFPHRNAILGRESSEQERAFLKMPNSSF